MKQRTRTSNFPDEVLSMGESNLKRSDSNNEIQLHRVRPHDHFIEAQISECDTLQAVALRFRCSIAELKRINQIHKDNEIFARRTIKIPVTPYSVLTEIIPTSTNDQEPKPSTSKQNVNPTLQNNGHLLPTSKIRSQIERKEDFSIDCNEVIMNSTIVPSVVPYTDTDGTEMAAEETLLLPNRSKEPVETVIVKQLTSQGADFGIKWYHLLCCLLFLGLLFPLYYALTYVHEHPPSHLVVTEHT